MTRNGDKCKISHLGSNTQLPSLSWGNPVWTAARVRKTQEPPNSIWSKSKTPVTKDSGILDNVDRGRSLRKTHGMQRPREECDCVVQAPVRREPAHGALGWTSGGHRMHTEEEHLWMNVCSRACSRAGKGVRGRDVQRNYWKKWSHSKSVQQQTNRALFKYWGNIEPSSNIEEKYVWKRKSIYFVHLRRAELGTSGILPFIYTYYSFYIMF